MGKNRPRREQDAVEAFVQLLRRKEQSWHFKHHPDDQIAPHGRQRKAPDYLYVGPLGQLLVEFTELATNPSEQLRRARSSKAEAAVLSIDWPPGEYTIYLLTSDDRKIRRLVDKGELSILAARVPSLEVSPIGTTESVLAFHRRDPAYYLADPSGLLVISKTSSGGRGQQVVLVVSAPPDGEIQLPDPHSATGVQKVATTSGTLRPLGELERTLTEVLTEADEKFLYEADAEAVLIIDVMSYSGPLRVQGVLRELSRNPWKQIDQVWLVVDEPYSDPAPATGEVSGKFRFWRAI